MTKWIYRAVGTVGVAAGGALLLAGGAAQADPINAPVNDLRGSLDGFLTPMGDHQGGGLADDLAPGQHLGFLGAVPLDPAAGVDPAALEAGPAPTAGQLGGGDNLTLVGLGDKQVDMDTVGQALDSVGKLADDPPAGSLLSSSPPQPGKQGQQSSAPPLLGDDLLGLSGGSGGGVLKEDQLTGALGDDNLNTIGSDSQMRTLGSTVGADQLGGFDTGALDSLSRDSGLGDLGRSGGLPLGELTNDPLGAVGKHAAPDPNDFSIADLRGGELDGLGQTLVPPLIGDALEAEMPPGFLGGLTEADGDSMVGLPLVGQLPLSALSTKGELPLLGGLGPAGGGSAPAGGTSAAAPAPAPAAARQQPAPSPTADDSGNNQRSHRQWSRSSSERPVDGEDADFR
jgi:hypothetical protein